MDRLIRDVRYALRSFSRSPGLTAVLLVTLAVGTGANATVFSFVDALLFRPADRVVDPARLAEVFTSDFSSGPYGNSSYPDYVSMRSGVSAFEQLAAFDDGGVSAIKIGDDAERARASRVTADYFGLLGVQPAIGRLIGPADLAPDAPRVAVIGYDLWKRAFELDTRILGKQIVVNGESYGIVGITPERFIGVDLGRRMDVWIPLVPPEDTPQEREKRGFRVLGRLKNGATLDGAKAELTVLAARLAAEYPGTNIGTREAPQAPRPMTAVRHARLDPETRSAVGVLSGIILGATALVLLIACANVASLLLSRATARGPEMAVRLALGASRGHLVRQLLTESVIVGIGGGALGMLFSLWTVGALPSFFPPEIAQLLDARVDGRVFVFTFVIALGSGIVFGLVPALQTRRPNVTAGLRGQSGVMEGSRVGTRTRNVMVVMQIALSGVLVVSTGLLTRSLSNAWRADLGYAARNVAVAYVQIPPGEFTEITGLQYFQQLADEVRRLPGVESAGLVYALPLSPGGRRGFRFDAYQPQPNEDMEININITGDAYFETMRVPLVAGRFFDARDTGKSGPVIVVNDVLAARFYGGSAVGRFATDSTDTRLEIVGVVRTGRYRDLQEAPLPIVYYPFSQEFRGRMTLVARTSGDPARHVETIAATMRGVRSGVPIYQTMTLDQYMSEALATERLATALVSSCGAMALVLAMVGVYGVMAYAVVRRSREIGVRLALGARPLQIVRLVFADGMRLTALGAAIGLVVAAALPTLLSAFLHDVNGPDGLSFAAAPSILALVAAIAAVAPVRRALSVDPMIVLRQQ